MEIHAPHQPVHSLREMLTHLVLVTLGVLIALSFEGIASWREHRALLHEARANILSELRDNQRDLTLASLAIEEGLGEGLVKEYERVLKGEEL